MVTLPAGSVATAGDALALRNGALQVAGINRAAYMHSTDCSLTLVIGFAKQITKREEAAAYLPAVVGQWRGLGPDDHTWKTVEGWGTDAKAQRPSQKGKRRAEREHLEIADRDRARADGKPIQHAILAAAIAQQEPSITTAPLAPRPPFRPILTQDLCRLAAGMSGEEWRAVKTKTDTGQSATAAGGGGGGGGSGSSGGGGSSGSSRSQRQRAISCAFV